MAVNNIPKHWEFKKLGDVLDIQGGSQPPKSNFIYDPKDGYIQLLQIRDFGEKGLPTYVPKSKVTKFCQKNDILIARYGASIGRIVSGKEGAYNVALAKVIDAKGTFEKRFIFYLLKTPIFQSPLKMLSRSAQNGFSKGEIADIDLPVPPIFEQQSIVSKIEELLSDLENGKQQLQLAQKQLKVYRQSLLKAAFEGKLTNKDVNSELPVGWKKLKTGEIIDTINNGYTPTKNHLSEGSGEIPFIKVYNLNFDGTLNFKKNPTFISNTIHRKELRRSICFPNDVLINIVGPPLGKVSIVSNQFPEWNINQAIVLFRPNENILSKFISYFLQNPVTINWLEETSKATAGQWNVKVSTCRLIPIPIPPIEEQQHIIDELESKLTICDKIEETINQSLQQAETLRQSILKKAFEGKLV